MTLDPLVEKWINLEISPEKLLTIALVFWLVSFGAIWRAWIASWSTIRRRRMLIQKKDVFNRTRRQIAQGGAARNCTISKTLPPPGMLARRVCDGTAK